MIDQAIKIADVTEKVESASIIDTAASSAIPKAQLLDVVFTNTGRDLPRPRAAGPTGVVTGSSVNLRSGPGTQFAVSGRGSKDQEFEVTGTRDGIWIEIIDPSQTEPVWIHGKYFIPPS